MANFCSLYFQDLSFFFVDIFWFFPQKVNFYGTLLYILFIVDDFMG